MSESNKNTLTKSVKKFFQGRLCRADLYLAMMLYVSLFLVCGMLLFVIVPVDDIVSGLVQYSTPIAIIFSVTLVILYVASVLIFLSLIVRRLHDMDSKWWQILLLFIPPFNFVFLLYVFLRPGSKGENAYGADRSNDPFFDVILNRPPRAEVATVSNRSKKRQTDFSVVLFRPTFMLASEENLMKAQKNQ